jgi:hypothetical protein
MDLGDVFSVLFIASVKAESMRMWYELHHGLQLGNATFLTVSSSRVPSDRGHSEPLYSCIISLYIYMTTTYYLIQYHHKICSCSTNKKTPVRWVMVLIVLGSLMPIQHHYGSPVLE